MVTMGTAFYRQVIGHFARTGLAQLGPGLVGHTKEVAALNSGQWFRCIANSTAKQSCQLHTNFHETEKNPAGYIHATTSTQIITSHVTPLY